MIPSLKTQFQTELFSIKYVQNVSYFNKVIELNEYNLYLSYIGVYLITSLAAMIHYVAKASCHVSIDVSSHVGCLRNMQNSW